jgi:hypothetical protein
MKISGKKALGLVLITIIIIASIGIFYYLDEGNNDNNGKKGQDTPRYIPPLGSMTLSFNYNFSEPEIVENGDFINMYVNEADVYSIGDGRPILPVNLSILEFPFGTKILDVNFSHAEIIEETISKKIAYGSYSPETAEFEPIYSMDELYPNDWVTYHKGGGLGSNGERKTFLAIRSYPVRYIPALDKINHIDNVIINVAYIEPDSPLIEEKSDYDLLILTPDSFTRRLNPLVEHKNKMGIKTKLVTIENAIQQGNQGVDQPEKIKYFIKSTVEKWGIKYVLLVGGIKRQSLKWNIPVRYSHVVPPEGTQEYPEVAFISDLYYADFYDSEGNFSSWNTNGNDIFAEWNEDGRDEMDLYPDVYIGRLPCRSIYEVKTMVDKIIEYETGKTEDKNWFKNLILIAGDSYEDDNNFNEGEHIAARAIELMPGFNPVEVYPVPGEDYDYKTINGAMKPGGGFVYFCGHGSATSWATHYPPDGTKWTEFYSTIHMNFLRNKEKLPIAVIGGCLNGKFDISVAKNIKSGIEKFGIRYFFSKFWTNGWQGHCWAWKLTVQGSGGTIATISNTGLGTHGRDDNDQNGVIDYLEVINGWQELRFLQLYGVEGRDILGENHVQTITEYLHRFNGNNDHMDVKMAQQWFLFGDPTLKIGGY